MRVVRCVAGIVVATVASSVAALPLTILSISVLAFRRWRIVPLHTVLHGVVSSAGWYWIALLPAACIPVAFRVAPPAAALTGAALAALASIPCVAGLTGRAVADVVRAASSRTTDFAIIAGSAAAGGAVTGAVAALIGRRFRDSV